MTGFDVTTLLTDADVAVWTEFNDEVRVKVRHVSREEQAQILKRATTISFDNRHQKQESIDMLKYGELVGQAAILEWSGLVASGAPLPCNPANIALLMRKWADFAKFVSDICSDLERLVAADRETVRKNSGSTSSPEVII